MLDKVTRVQSLVTEVGLSLELTEDTLGVVHDAASLAMSDLSTAVVTEFTSLAGVMARHYALRDGYSEQVVSRIPASLVVNNLMCVDSFSSLKSPSEPGAW